MAGSLGSDHRGVVCRSQGPAGQGQGGGRGKAPRGGWAGNLDLSSDTSTPIGCPSLARVPTY